MSFAQEVKTELCAPGKGCEEAEAYGLLLFGRSFGPGGLSIQTEHTGTAQAAQEILQGRFSVCPTVRRSERSDGHTVTTVSVDDPAEAARIFSSFGYDDRTVTLRINRANLDGEGSAAAFVRGAFLSCGSVVNPGKDYHLEFVTPHLYLSRDLSYLLRECEFEPKQVRRKGNHVVYFKDSGQIEDLLTFMGAARQSLELMNVKIYKDLRNKANRVTNCETANIEKTVNASANQVSAIQKLLRAADASLPDDLREVALLRLENPDMSLRELGALLKMPLSRSGVNHRLNRILRLAEKL